MDSSVAELPTDFDLKLENKFNDSEFKKILPKIIKNLIEIARKNDKIVIFLQDYISRVNIYLSTLSNSLDGISSYNSSNSSYQKQSIKGIIQNMFKMTFMKSGGKQKKEFSKIYNIFYPIILYQYLVDKKFIKDVEKRNLLKDNLKFSVSSVDQRGMMMGQQLTSDDFTKNSWNVLNNLMEMLYGKMNNKIDRNSDKIQSVTYMYPLYINVVETVHSLNYFNLYHSCHIDTTVGEYKKFTTTLITSCSQRSQGFGQAPQGFQFGQSGGVSRTEAIMRNPCDDFERNIQGIGTLLSSRPTNDVCKITRLAKIKFAKESGNAANKMTNANISSAAANVRNMIKLLTNKVANEKEEDSLIYEDGFCDYDPFWAKLLLLYFDVGKEIIRLFESNIRNEDDESKLQSIKTIIDNNDINIINKNNLKAVLD